jgi:DNA-binding transcriptional LysR family regulator
MSNEEDSMDLGQLEIFLCIADEKSFSRAAEKVRRTQPALSIAIKRLEIELGEPLFDRSTKGGMLTEAGRVLYSYAQRLVNLREEARGAINELRGMYQGRLTIGANESTSLYLLPQMLVEYRRRYPQIKIEVHRAVSERIPTEVYERNLDVGFLSYDPIQTGLQSIEVERDELVLFVAHNVRSPARDRIFDLFRDHQTPLHICVELSILETIKDFVSLGVGLAILPRLSVQEAIESGRLCSVPVEGMKIEKTLRLVFRREETLSHAARAFLQLVRESRSIHPTNDLPPVPQR